MRSVLNAVLFLVAPNVAFLGIHYAAKLPPVEPMKQRVALAFDRGDLLADTASFVFLDSARGVEPWGDANTLRMALHRGRSAWQDALAPRLLKPSDGVERHPAAELRGAVFGTLAFDPASGFYHRYWHGNVAVASFLLSLFDVRQSRLVLMSASYFLFALIPLVACRRSRSLGILMGWICCSGVWFSALPYHGQTFAYAPAFIWSQLVVLPVLMRPDWPVAPLALVLGAGAAFLEPMSGGFVLAGCLFFLTLYFSSPESERGSEALRRASAGLAWFLCAVAFSIVFKQILVSLFFGWDQTFGTFLGQLRWRMGLAEDQTTYAELVWTVGNHLVYLTFGSVLLAKVLVFASGAAFLAGCGLVAFDLYGNRSRRRLWDYLAVFGMLALFMAWFLALPSHNKIHAWITVRLLYVPFALAWVLLWFSAPALRATARTGPVADCAERQPDTVR